MNIQVRAAGKTAGMLAVSTLAAVAVFGLFSLESETIAWILMSSAMAFFVWVVYSINLGQIRHDQETKEIEQRINQAQSNKQV
jgi:ABC-type transport system involved in cytochrome c biogenesis permease subunit